MILTSMMLGTTGGNRSPLNRLRSGMTCSHLGCGLPGGSSPGNGVCPSAMIPPVTYTLRIPATLRIAPQGVTAPVTITALIRTSSPAPPPAGPPPPGPPGELAKPGAPGGGPPGTLPPGAPGTPGVPGGKLGGPAGAPGNALAAASSTKPDAKSIGCGVPPQGSFTASYACWAAKAKAV